MFKESYQKLKSGYGLNFSNSHKTLHVVVKNYE